MRPETVNQNGVHVTYDSAIRPALTNLVHRIRTRSWRPNEVQPPPYDLVFEIWLAESKIRLRAVVQARQHDDLDGVESQVGAALVELRELVSGASEKEGTWTVRVSRGEIQLPDGPDLD